MALKCVNRPYRSLYEHKRPTYQEQKGYSAHRVSCAYVDANGRHQSCRAAETSPYCVANADDGVKLAK